MSIPVSRWFGCAASSALLALLLVGAGAGTASAQDATPPESRPYRGLFGGGNPNPQQLELTWSTFLVRDDNVTAGTRGYDPMYQASGSFGDAVGTLGYSTHGSHASFAVRGEANGRYYPELHELSEIGGRGDVTVALEYGKNQPNKTSINAYQSYSYQPFYALNLFGTTPSQPPVAGALPSTGSDALTTLTSRDYDGTAKLMRSWGTQTTLVASYEYRRSQLGANPLPFLWQTANTAFTHKVTKYGALRLGYGYGVGHDGTLEGIPATINQNIDVGIDYSRPLSTTRRTSFGVTTGSSIITSLGIRYYRLVADATVARELGRTWHAKGTYHRGLQYVQGISAPLYADTAEAGIGGLMTKRVNLAFTGAYANGQIGLSAINSPYVTYSGTTTLRFALNRSLSFDAEYHYYYYDFQQSVLVPAGIPPILQRQGFRIGVTAWSGLMR
jgi:hypothetical protein